MQLNVARDSPARLYTVGVERNGMLEDDLAFYLVATGGAYAEESFVGALLSTNRCQAHLPAVASCGSQSLTSVLN